MTDIERFVISAKAEKEFEWRKWAQEIPYINWPEVWEVKAIPPFNGAIIRYFVRPIGRPENEHVSIYLDCYDILGLWGEPYWEIHPHNDDIFRCNMNDTTALIEAIGESFAQQREQGQ